MIPTTPKKGEPVNAHREVAAAGVIEHDEDPLSSREVDGPPPSFLAMQNEETLMTM